MIARLCLSDLHLGDARSVLSQPDTVASVVRRLALLAGDPGPGDDKPTVGTLVLNGDVWEECVPSGMEEHSTDMFQKSVAEASQRFFGQLLDAVAVQKIVWVPGNHDLSLWRLWCSLVSGSSPLTRYEGQPLDMGSQKWHSTFDYLLGRRPVPAFWVSYPLFVEKPWAEGFPYVAFTHGHLLDPLVRGLDSDATYLALRALGCGRPGVPDSPVSVSQLAKCTDNFTLSLWQRYSRRDWVYSNQIMRRLEHPSSCPLQSASAPESVSPADQLTDPSPPPRRPHVPGAVVPGRRGRGSRAADPRRRPAHPQRERGLHQALLPGLRARPPGQQAHGGVERRPARGGRLRGLDVRARRPTVPLARARVARPRGRGARGLPPAHPARGGVIVVPI